ncbi:MAG: arylesterase [Verrucomicrobiae bacterium]|nr:arylesterase [Verrucomicrobiae bacterium]
MRFRNLSILWFLAFAALPILHAADSGPKTIVVLGDSLAAGYGVELDEAYPALLQKKITDAGWPDNVVNAGVSGDTSSDGLARIDWVLKQKVDVLLLELGGNDGLRGIPVDVTRRNLLEIIERTRAKYPGVRIILAGMRMPPNVGQRYGDSFAQMFPELARTSRAELVPFLLEGVGGKTGLGLNQADGIHPTGAGHRMVAENVWKVLRPVLEKLHAESSRSP